MVLMGLCYVVCLSVLQKKKNNYKKGSITFQIKNIKKYKELEQTNRIYK